MQQTSKSALSMVSITIGGLALWTACAIAVRAEQGANSSKPTVVVKAWTVDRTLAKPGDEALVGSVANIRFELAKDEASSSSTVRMSGSRFPFRRGEEEPRMEEFTMTAVGRQFPVQADISVTSWDVQQQPYAISGRVTIERSGRIGAVVGENPNVILLVQLTEVPE